MTRAGNLAWVARLLGCAALILVCGVLPSRAADLYAQPRVTAAELDRLIDDLPQFRDWLRANGETAHPVLTPDGRPGFLYSPRTADHVGQLGWEPERFFCVMGRAAAALAIIEQGQEIRDRLLADMPEVAPEELDLVQDRLPALLRAVEADAGNGAPGSLQKK